MTTGLPPIGDPAGPSPDPARPGDGPGPPRVPVSRLTTSQLPGPDEDDVHPVGFRVPQYPPDRDGYHDTGPAEQELSDDDPVVPLVAERDVITLNDPRAIRALAHPARISAVDHLFAGEVLTATECARIADVSPSAMSYHLRALERWGLVVRAEATGDGRERPWRAAARRLHVGDAEGTAVRAAQDQLLGSLVDLLRADLTRGLALVERHSDEKPVADFAMLAAALTPSEARDLMGRIDELIRPYVTRQDVPEDARGYHLYGAILPLGGERNTPRR